MEIGNKVVCLKTLKSTNQPITGPKKDQIYIIKDIKKCPCGNIAFHVGFSISNFPPITRFIIDCICGRTYRENIWWCSYKYFAPLLSDLAQKAINDIKKEIHKQNTKEVEIIE